MGCPDRILPKGSTGRSNTPQALRTSHPYHYAFDQISTDIMSANESAR